MNAFRRTLPAVSRAVVASAIALAAGASHAAVGAKLIIQGWEPWNDNRQPTVVPIDDPQLISRPLVEGWNMLRQPLCQMIESAIGQPDMIYRGITLYEIGCDIRPLDVSMVPVTPNRVRLIVSLAGSRLSVKATTPNLRDIGVKLPVIGGLALPSGADPRFSVRADGVLEVDVEIGDAPRPFLTVHGVRYDLRHADARGENITGKLAEFVASKVIPFFGGPNFERRIESRIDAVKGDLTARAQRLFATVNQRVAGYAQYVRIATWTSPTRIAIALQPRNLPVIRTGGEMRGVFVAARTRGGEAGRMPDCGGFRMSAQYQTGPAPLLDPDTLARGPAPRVAVTEAPVVQARADGTCTFALPGLALGVTNYVHASHVLDRAASAQTVATTQGRLVAPAVTIQAAGWDGLRVLPAPVALNRNYVVGYRPAPAVTAIRRALGEPQPAAPIVYEQTTLSGQPSGGAAAARRIFN